MFTSTNKIYGEMSDVKLKRTPTRYEPEDQDLRLHGFDEQRAIQFHSPYGCSKGAACQYVQDYARTFKMRTTVFRMSCIYGPHQFGTEDQGWVAHFLIKAMQGTPLTIYGDGRQVRDILFVEDLVDAFLFAQENMDKVSGEVFNMGGGPGNTISLLEILEVIRELSGRDVEIQYSDWRTADQQYYVSDTRKFSSLTGWKPAHSARDGIASLYRWLLDSRGRSKRVSVEDLTIRSNTSPILSKRVAPGRNGKVKPPRLAATRKRRPNKLVHLE